MKKYKHLRVTEQTHNRVLMIRGILASKGKNISIHEIVEELVNKKLSELRDK